MLLFCDGMPRSASTWVYNVAFALLKTTFPAADIRRAVYVSPATLDATEHGADWAIMKCHRLDDHTRAVFRAGRARAIYTHRDIYDAMASYLMMFRVSFDFSLATMLDSLDSYDFHCETGNFLCVDYESIVNKSEDVIQRIARFLDLSVPESEIALIAESHSLQAIKELSANLKQNGQDRLIRDSLSCYDPETQWHVRHVRNGGIGYGHKYLLPWQIEWIEYVIRNRQGPSKEILPALPPSSALAGAAG
ncbi:MAG TPA: sulfotransferase [Bryobacteraceae bacterium]|jgi:hypothetical protein|nr:sulfotransferase [Bryobacteraceae bacterium]